jgi:pimeloyl-ACP methyl ester carboxylesterase
VTTRPAIISQDCLVPALDPGIELFVRNKRRADLGAVGPERSLLFLHGGSQSSEATFDLAVDGFSWADYIAARGWDVWLMDLRGYGGSTKPPEMSLPAGEAAPCGRLDTQVRDFEAVVTHVLTARQLPWINVLAWSWGSVVSTHWAAEHPDKIGRIALFGPPWLYDQFPGALRDNLAADTPLPGYSSWTIEETWKRFKYGQPQGLADDQTPAAWREAWAAATLATDPQAFEHDPPRVRSPGGTALDLREKARAGQPIFPADRIASPVLVAVGEWDGMTPPGGALALFGALTASAERRLVVLGSATHVAHLERRRLELFAVVQDFLEGPQP